MISLQRMRELAKREQPTGIKIMKKITLPGTETKMRSSEKLAEALHAIGLDDMAAKAKAFAYDDFKSESATPIMDLVNELARVGSVDALALRKRVIDGEFDSTAEESEEWAKSPEGQEAMNMLIKGR